MFRFVLFLIFLIPTASWTQDHPHASMWMDEYNIQHHCTGYLSNKAGQREYYRYWNDSLKSFVSSIPDYLTYVPAAGQKLTVTNYEIDYRDEYQILKWDLFSPKRMDSLLKKNNVIAEVNLSYDEQGRLLSSTQKDATRKIGAEEKMYTFLYVDSGEFELLKFELKTKEFRFFGRYSSLYAGNFNYRPLRLRSHWSMEYVFDAKQRLTRASSAYVSKANQRMNSKPGYYTYTYQWDEKGRMLQRDYYSSSDSVRKVLEQSFVERSFVLEAEIEIYPVLKTPSIQRWIAEQYEPEELRIIEYSGENNSGEYLVDKNDQPILLLSKSNDSRKLFYQTLLDSNSIYKSRFEFYKLPDTTDRTTYDPNFVPMLMERTTSGCIIQSTYTRTPGLLYGRETRGYKKTAYPLNEGWTLIAYESGSNDYGTARFAVGFAPLIRLDILNTKYVILDPEGKVQYFGSYRKMSKVNW